MGFSPPLARGRYEAPRFNEPDPRRPLSEPPPQPARQRGSSGVFPAALALARTSGARGDVHQPWAHAPRGGARRAGSGNRSQTETPGAKQQLGKEAGLPGTRSRRSGGPAFGGHGQAPGKWGGAAGRGVAGGGAAAPAVPGEGRAGADAAGGCWRCVLRRG